MTLAPTTAAWWAQAMHALSLLAGWLESREPAGVPHWAWAALLVVAGLAAARIGGRMLAAAFQIATVAAALVIGWHVLHGAG